MQPASLDFDYALYLRYSDSGLSMAIEHQGAAIVPSPFVSIRALLVDRDEDTREMYAECLRRASYDVEHAADGRQALALAVSHRPHIVITETQLPGIDGLDLCRLLRADRATSATPIIVVTGDCYPADILRAQEAGATEVLIKPCLPEVLLATTTQLLQSSRALVGRAESAQGDRAMQLPRSRPIEARVHRPLRTLVRSHNRCQTDSPPLAPLQLTCPECGATLLYEHSHIGGVSANNSEQWDYFRCPSGCGSYQYRHRTQKIRKVG